MASYIFCPKPSEGVRALASGLGAGLISSFDGLRFRKARKTVHLAPGDNLVCWGLTLPPLDGIRMLNGTEDPLDDLAALKQARYARYEGSYSTIKIDYAKDVPTHKAKLAGLIPRAIGHNSGDDILFPTGRVDYWSTKYTFQDQWRCHVFMGKFVRCGTRVLKEGYELCKANEWKRDSNLSHPWVKTDLGGWDLNYGDPKPALSVRTMAVGVIKGLDLDFGTVDIGYDGDHYYLIGINLAPDLPNAKAIEGYTLRLGKWFSGVKDDSGKEGKG